MSAATIAIFLTVLGTLLLRASHPPAGATALLVALGTLRTAHERKGIVRQGLERDATVTAAKLAQQRPGAEGRSLARHLNRVQLALRRMRYRDYGLCAACGRPISDARLRLMPTAGTCTACQKRLDAEARGEQR